MKFEIIIRDASEQDITRLAQLLQTTAPAATVELSDVIVVEKKEPDVFNGFPPEYHVAPLNVEATVYQPIATPPERMFNQGNDVDSSGLPWDERIHASTKTKKKDGTWTSRRGVDDTTILNVENELRGQQPTCPAGFGTLPPIPPAPPASSIPSYHQATAPMATPVHQPSTVHAVPVAPVQQQPEITFQSLMMKISGLFAQQKINPDYMYSLVNRVAQIYNTHLNTIQDVASNPEMVKYTFDLVSRDEANNFQA